MTYSDRETEVELSQQLECLQTPKGGEGLSPTFSSLLFHPSPAPSVSLHVNGNVSLWPPRNSHFLNPLFFFLALIIGSFLNILFLLEIKTGKGKAQHMLDVGFCFLDYQGQTYQLLNS